MSMKVAQLGQPILRQRTVEVPAEAVADDELQRFIDEMIVTMKESRGVGLAAPQVFSGRRLFVADVLPPERPGQRARTEVFINPVLSECSDEKVSAWEGCLSFIELLVLVPRHKALRIDYVDRLGEAKSLRLSGFPARVVQHEFDHLEGILTIDRAVTTHDIIKQSELDAVEDRPDGR